jgi:PAS domain S-box-containing protein
MTTDLPRQCKRARMTRLTPDHLHQNAFDNSLLPNIISIADNGKIIAANQAAEKLLGYSGKELLLKKFEEIFSLTDDHFKKILKQRAAAGHAIGNLSVIKKSGRELPCQITSVVFIGDNNIRKVITTLVDRRQGIRMQNGIDLEKNKIVAADLLLALSESDATLTRLHHLEHKLDEEISANEVSFKLNAIHMADAVSEAKETVRSDLGKELHDNVNQLLAASKIYMDLALRNPANQRDHINKSSEYTATAIEEIRKLAKGLVHNAIRNVGLCTAIEEMTRGLMEAYPIKIHCDMNDEQHFHLNSKFKLDVFRIVQEQVNNIIKHAQASCVRISFFRQEDIFVLSVGDDGVGFDTGKKTEGIGISNIKSRAEFYKGLATFVSEAGQGCILTVQFPIGESTMDNL